MRRDAGGVWAKAFAGLAAAALAAGCNFGFTWTFSVDEETPEISIEGDLTGGLLSGMSESVEMSVQHEPGFEEEEFDYIECVVLAGAVLEIAGSSTDPGSDPLEDGEPDSFAFIEAIELYIEADIAGVPRRELVAYLDPAKAGSPGDRLELETTGVNVVSFIEAPGGYVITTEATGSVPPDKVIFEGNVTYEVTVGLYL
jgi:hypothetical protein